MTSDKKRLQIAVISGASHALSYKRQNPHATDEEAIQHVSSEMSQILRKVDSAD